MAIKSGNVEGAGKSGSPIRNRNDRLRELGIGLLLNRSHFRRVIPFNEVKGSVRDSLGVALAYIRTEGARNTCFRENCWLGCENNKTEVVTYHQWQRYCSLLFFKNFISWERKELPKIEHEMNSINICSTCRPNRMLFCRISLRFPVTEV